MAEVPRKRGRPKGSGIDDGTMLAAIARLRAVDPDLKPTTAIRKLGITDPSVVRRLRDKLKDWPAVTRAAQSSLLATSKTEPLSPSTRKKKQSRGLPGRISNPILVNQDPSQARSGTQDQNPKPSGQAPPTTIADKPTENTAAPAESTKPRSDQHPTKVTAPEADATSSTAADYSGGSQRSDSQMIASQVIDPQLEAMRLAAEAAAAMSRLYLHCLTYANQMTPLALALRGQTMTSQWLAAAMAGQQAAFRAMAKK